MKDISNAGNVHEEHIAATTHGPTIHSVVMDNRTTDLFDLIDRDVKTRLGDFRLAFIAVQEDAIRQAYIRGVRDGFQQGALAPAANLHELVQDVVGEIGEYSEGLAPNDLLGAVEWLIREETRTRIERDRYEASLTKIAELQSPTYPYGRNASREVGDMRRIAREALA